MIDPYSVLGVSSSATDEEIKKAYRSLSRKYHPDANINNPNKDAAEAKFKEVQQAYSQIMDEREKGYTGGSNSYGGYGGYNGYGQQSSGAGYSENDSHMQAAMHYIQSGHYKEALNVLDTITPRNAQWYFLSAVANSGIGNNVTALEHAEEAVRLEPGNMQYQMYLQRLNGTGGWYSGQQQSMGTSVFGGGDFCCKLMVANALCSVCGGPGCFIMPCCL